MSFAQPFSNYEILARVGSGAMGTVFQARQKHMDRIVALKVLKPALARNARYVDRLRREARIVGQLSHPNIVTGYDLGEEGGYHFFVMEFVEGRSLRQLLAEWGSFPEEQVLDVAIQVTGALDHAWQRGVIHRDVKPGNILITEDGRVKLTDMGLAKGATDLTLTRHGATVGTPQYISPEQARDPSSVDVRSDLYSLGATLFHMATGQPPFRADSIGELISKVLDERAPSATDLNPELSSGLSLVIQKLLAKNPALRYQTPRELLEDLERVRRAERPRVDVSALAHERRRRTSRRSRWLAWGSAAAFLCFAALAVVYWPRHNGDGDPSGGDAAAFRRTVLTGLDAAAGFPERFAALERLRATTTGDSRLAVLADEERRLANEVASRVDALCDRYTGERRAETEQWLADPEHWTDEAGFVRDVAVPAIRELTGFAPAALPDARLRATVAGRLDALRAEIAPLCTSRDEAYARRFEQFAREDVMRPVRASLEREDFAAAQRLLDERLDAFHGDDHRPALARLSPDLRERLETRRKAVRALLEGEIRVAQQGAAAQLVHDATARFDAIQRMHDDLAERGADPGPLREALDRAERELRRHHPTSDAFPDKAVDPWPEIESRLRALRSDLAALERRFDQGVLDGFLALGYRVFAESGPTPAARVVASARVLSPAVEARRREHVAVFEHAARFRSELLSALLVGQETVRLGGVTVRADEHGPVVDSIADGAPVPSLALDLETLLASAPEPFRQAVSKDDELRQGRAFWRFARGDPAGAQSLLSDGTLGFYVEQVWPHLRELGAGKPSDTEATAALEQIREAQARGDYETVRASLDAFEKRFQDTPMAAQSVAVRSTFAEWARVAERRASMEADIRRRVTGGMSVRVDDDGVIEIEGSAGDVPAGARPQDWVVRDGGLMLDSGWLEPAAARDRQLEIAAPFAADADVELRAEIAFPRVSEEPRVVVVGIHGLAIALCALPSGAVAAAVVPAAAAFDPAALDRAMAGPIVTAGDAPFVVPGAWLEIEVRIEQRRGKDVAVRVTLPGDGDRELCSARVPAPDRIDPVVRFGGFQAMGVRRIRMRGHH